MNEHAVQKMEVWANLSDLPATYTPFFPITFFRLNQPASKWSIIPSKNHSKLPKS